MDGEDFGSCLGCLYFVPSQLVALLVYAGGGLSLFASGEMLECVVWIVFLGPIVAEVVGLLWPLFLIIWLLA